MIGIPERAVYGITKAGLIQMTKMLAVEWASKDIRVNAVAPATVMTASREKLLSEPEARARMLSRIPIGRFVKPEEVAAAVLLKPGMSLTEDELRSFLLSSIAKFKVPSKIWFRTEPIPRNANGKFLKREVRKELIGE